MAEYIEREALKDRMADFVPPFIDESNRAYVDGLTDAYTLICQAPAADVVEEENILKFYYVRSIDEYWIGRRIDNYYYSEYDPKSRQWVWTHSRYLPWGEHIVSPTSLWKEYTYPSEPEEIPFEEWLQGFVKKHAFGVVERKAGKWLKSAWSIRCSECGYDMPFAVRNFCPNCGARWRADDA